MIAGYTVVLCWAWLSENSWLLPIVLTAHSSLVCFRCKESKQRMAAMLSWHSRTIRSFSSNSMAVMGATTDGHILSAVPLSSTGVSSKQILKVHPEIPIFVFIDKLGSHDSLFIVSSPVFTKIFTTSEPTVWRETYFLLEVHNKSLRTSHCNHMSNNSHTCLRPGIVDKSF